MALPALGSAADVLCLYEGRHYSPDDYEDLTHNSLGMAIASDVMMWRAMGVNH